MLSYIDLEYTNYRIQRDMHAQEQWNAFSDSQKESYLNHSALLLDQACIFAGRKYSQNQIMEFPRYFEESFGLNGQIPRDIQQAQLFILSYLLKTIDYEELRKAGTIGITESSDELSLTSKHGFNQVPVEASLLLFPFSRLGWETSSRDNLRYQFGREEDL